MQEQELQKISDELNLNINDVKYLIRTTSPYCKCGNLKRIIQSKQSKLGIKFFPWCSKGCDPKVGRKRPEHSAKMKKLAADETNATFNNVLIQKNQLKNKKVNTPEFKRKFLQNKNLDVDNLNDEEIVIKFTEFKSQFMKSRDKRIKIIQQRFDNWEDEFKKLILIITNNIEPHNIDLLNMAQSDFDLLYKRIHGVNTIRNWSIIQESRTSFFKRIKKSNFLYNTADQQEVITKSGLESCYIDFFETYHIPWEYETLRLETIDKKGFHTPDFIINFNDKRYILETKGNFYRQEIAEYLSNKVAAVQIYAKQNDMYYVLTTIQKPNIKGNFIEEALIKE